MRKKQIEKVREEFEHMDLRRYHILTYDELLKVNGGSENDSDDNDDETAESESEETSDEGVETATESTPSEEGTSESTSSGTNSESESGGHEIENTVEAVANAEVGDTLTRDDGTQVTITEGDITWAQEHCDSYGKNGEEEKEESPAKESDLPSAEEADCSKTEQEEGGSRRIENSDEAVANAKPGDTLVRDDGTVVTLKEVDIEQAQEKLGIGEHKEDEKSPSKEGELAEKSSGENKNTKGENAAEERAYINSKLDTPKGNTVDLYKEFCEIVSELKIGLSASNSFSIKDIVYVGVELDLFSQSYRNGENYCTSGAKFYVQGGADIAPMFQFGGEYSKEIIHATPFDLPSYDYEFKPIADVNTTGNLTFPLGGFGSITINTAETIDFFTKAFDF